MFVEAAGACTDIFNSLIDLEMTLHLLVDSGALSATVKDAPMKKKLDELDALAQGVPLGDKDGGSWTKEDPDIKQIRESLGENTAFDPPSPKADDLRKKEEGCV
ncbi:uncharacterized protein LAJ45_01211 [Morchella importuna]|uniref:uncharacterized protein n=1 Tax=Morchella importuna TaxID=1174673 RepID=UPI001E8DA708|nr:uncharacterized protein LAJ45_01211 [Morchella importuna]KAH8154680.1 hypothetical protein LAJ45_01211 [Morchella importuna]